MDQWNSTAHIGQLRNYRNKISKLRVLAFLSYQRVKDTYDFVHQGEPYATPVVDDKTPGEIEAFLRAFEQLEIQFDNARISYNSARTQHLKITHCISNYVRSVMVQELTSTFAKMNAIVPIIVNTIADQAINSSRQMWIALREEVQITYHAYRDVRKSRSSLVNEQKKCLDIACTNPVVQEAVLWYIDEWVMRLRTKIHKYDRILRTVKHQLWKIRSYK